MDEDLRGALGRVDPPAGFADRVVQLASASPERPKAAKAGRAILVTRLAIAATLVITVGGGAWYRAEERRKQEGEEAKRQVLLSLSIAGSKLRSIEMKVNNHNEER